jgi:hypothetical protein
LDGVTDVDGGAVRDRCILLENADIRLVLAGVVELVVVIGRKAIEAAR